MIQISVAGVIKGKIAKSNQESEEYKEIMQVMFGMGMGGNDNSGEFSSYVSK